jgi:mannose-6-phosphate isomerase-like protein (cupin superfamily)
MEVKMRITLVATLAMLLTISQTSTFVQSGPAAGAATYITAEDIKAVLSHTPPSTDRQIRTLDLGKYQLAVGVIHRGPTQGPAATTAGRGTGAARGAGTAAAAVPCGEKEGPVSGVNGLYHDSTAETYIITSGGGTLVTGGYIVNGRRSAPDNQVTTILNGPSCSGSIAGTDVVRREVKVGDVIVIPAGVPHGWTAIIDHVTYLSVRPDPDKVLQKGYIHPAIARRPPI